MLHVLPLCLPFCSPVWLPLVEQRVFVNSAAKIIVHPAVAELGSIPENKGRTVKELKRSELLHRAVVVALAVVMMVALAVVMMVVSVRTGTSC